ncbi:MAG: hypothetical protein ACKVW3_01900 [Phycisphaerales bacterium]
MSISLDPMTSSPASMMPSGPDARPETLRDLLMRAASIVTRDGILDGDEQAAITEFLLVIKTSQEGRIAGGAGGAMDPAAQATQQALASNGAMGYTPGAGETEPYGTVPGTQMRGPY